MRVRGSVFCPSLDSVAPCKIYSFVCARGPCSVSLTKKDREIEAEKGRREEISEHFITQPGRRLWRGGVGVPECRSWGRVAGGGVWGSGGQLPVQLCRNFLKGHG